MRRCFLFLAVLGVAGAVHADQGTTAASFLLLDTSPRVIGMGGSFAGIADDVSDIEYNPAGSAYLTQKELTIMDAVWVQGIDYGYGALAWPSDYGTFSADVFYLDAGTFQGTALNANDQVVDTGSFTAADMYGTLAYSRKILSIPHWGDFSAGVSLKYLDESIAEYSSSSEALGLSAFYHTPIPGLNAGLALSNMGPSEEGYALPFNARFGVGYQPSDNISVDMDYLQYANTAGIWSVGGEYGYRILVFRMGYKYQGAVDYNDTEESYGPAVASGLSLGLGVKLFTAYSLDYSYVPYGFLGASNDISFSMKFD
jgi:Uncharacterised protein family (UPF0164)